MARGVLIRCAHTNAACIDDFRRRQEAAAGRIVFVTLAPEVEGALELIEYLVKNERPRRYRAQRSESPQIDPRRVSAGATMSTHLGNGCAAILPRHPNLIWEQLAADELLASLIVDGHHLPPAMVKSAVRAKSPAAHDPRVRRHGGGRLCSRGRTDWATWTSRLEPTGAFRCGAPRSSPVRR